MPDYLIIIIFLISFFTLYMIQSVKTDPISETFYSSKVNFPFLSHQALEGGHLVRGGIVFEGSAGSTAISIATVAPAFGCKCHVVIPDDAAIEKVFVFFAQ